VARSEPTSSEPPTDDAAYVAAVDAGKTSLDLGRGIPWETVRRWLLSWGTDKELPPPKCP